MSAPRIAVVGAGAFGGWTALHLQRSGARVTLYDAWGPGNPRSSSGGRTRVLRAVYGSDRIYAEMVARSLPLWKELEAALPQPLYVETGALWLHRGDDAYVRASAGTLSDLGLPLRELSLPDARRRYPQIAFEGVRSVWLEPVAGVLHARRACLAVRDALILEGGRYLPEHVGPHAGLEADVRVFACGPWLSRLFPELGETVVLPTRQEIYYFGTPPASQRYAAGSLPVWLEFGERILYGLPDLEGRGFKLADDTRGAPFDPTDGDRTPGQEGIARARRFLAERFPELARAPLLQAEVCQYENSPDGHLLLDRHPERSDVWLVGGGSGHGFKLGPAVGELAAAAILSGRSVPETFRLERLRGARGARQTTQFESGAG